MTRILVVTAQYPPAEGESLRLLEDLAGRGHHVEVVCTEPSRGRSIGGVPVRPSLSARRPQGRGHRWAWRSLVSDGRADQAAIREALEAVKPDVVVAWRLTGVSIGPLLTVVRLGLPLVYLFSDTWPVDALKQDTWLSRWQGNPARRVVGGIAAKLTGLPVRVQDLGSAGYACFWSDALRSEIEAESLWTAPVGVVLPEHGTLDDVVDQIERCITVATDATPDATPDESPEVTPLDRHRAAVERVLRRGGASCPDSDQVKALYRELGDDWWTAHEKTNSDVPVLSFPETTPVVISHLDRVRGTILDAGCGPNPAVSIGLGRRASRVVVAMDIGVGTVRLARDQASRRGVGILGVVGDVERLPFRDQTFDGIVCDDTIEHLPDDAAGVSELARVLTPDGVAVLATPNRHSALVLRRRLSDWWHGRSRPRHTYYAASSHLREYTWHDFERLARTAFEVTDRVAVGWSQGPRRALFSQFLKGPLRWLSQAILIEVRPRRHPRGICHSPSEVVTT